MQAWKLKYHQIQYYNTVFTVLWIFQFLVITRITNSCYIFANNYSYQMDTYGMYIIEFHNNA